MTPEREVEIRRASANGWLCDSEDEILIALDDERAVHAETRQCALGLGRLLEEANAQVKALEERVRGLEDIVDSCRCDAE